MIKLICIKETNVTMNEENIKSLSKVASEINCSISDLLPTFGKEYTLINVVHNKTVSGTNNDIWYRLEETGDLIHHSSLFAISPSSFRDFKISSLID